MDLFVWAKQPDDKIMATNKNSKYLFFDSMRENYLSDLKLKVKQSESA